MPHQLRTNYFRWLTAAVIALVILGTVATPASASLTFGATTLTGDGDVTINGSATGTVTIGSNVTSGAITIGSATAQNVSITDNNWGITATGAATFASLVVSTGGSITVPTGSIALVALADDSDSTKVLTAGGAGGDPHWAAAPSPGAGTIGATQLTDMTCLAPFLGSGYIGASGSGTYYFAGPNDPRIDEAYAAIVPVDMVVHSLNAKANGGPGSGKTIVVTVRDDSADTAVTCTISGTATTCIDAVNSTTIAAGSKITIGSVQTSGGSTTVLAAGFCFGQ